MERLRPALAVLACLALVPIVAAAAEPPSEEIVMRVARLPLPEFLAEWSRQAGKTCRYSAYLPDVPVVVAEPADDDEPAEPGGTKSLTSVLRPLGWEAKPLKDGVVIVRTNDDRLVPLHRTTLWTSKDEAARRRAAYELGRLSVPTAIHALVKGLEDESLSVRFHCLEALWAIESDFEMRRLPGRVSMMRVALRKPEALLRLARGCDDRPRRAWRYAVALLGRAGVDAARPIAVAGLTDGDPRVRLTAARALREVAQPADEKALADFVRTTDDWAARREAICALARLPDFGTTLNVANAATGTDEDLACLACEALGYVERPEAVAPLAEALRTGGPERAALAAEALGRLNQAPAEQALVAALKSSGEAWRRAAAARGLAVVGRKRTQTAMGALIAASRGSARASGAAQAVRAAAADGLATCGGPMATKRLVALAGDENAHVRLAAVRALRRLGGKAALASLKALASDPDPRVAHDATRGVGWLGGVKEARWLATVVTNKSMGRNGPEAAVMALADLTGPETRDIAVQTLIDVMQDPRTCPYAVGRAATKLADARLVPGLIRIQKNRSAGGSLRVDTMDALGRIGTHEAINALIRNWWEYHNMPRYQGGRAVRDNVHQPAVLAGLLGMLKRSGTPREAAAFSLCEARDPRAVDGLIRVLKARKGGVIGAATSLGLIADPAATDALLEAANDPTHPGRFVAARALRMRDLAWQPPVKQALIDLYGWRADGTPPPIEEQKPNSWVLRRWAQDYGDMSVSRLCYESGVTFDTRRGRVVQWGAHGRRYDAPQTPETWIYDPDTNTWKEAGLRELPPGTCCTREVSYDQVNDRVVVTKGGGGGHGWLCIKEQTLRRSIPWVYDPETDRWIAMRPTGAPAFAAFPTHAFDRRHGVLVAYTTRTQPASVWTYDVHTNQWLRQPMKGAAPLAEGYGHLMAYDSRRGRVLFGGKGLLAGYDLAKGTWTDLGTKGQPDRMSPMIYDAVNDVVLGFNPGLKGTAVYTHDLQSGSWSKHTTSGMQPDYREWDAAFDPARNVAFICGGEVTSNPGSPNCRETWTYRFATSRRALPLKAPGRVALSVAGRQAQLAWEPARDERVVGYVVYRAAAERTWGAAFEKVTRTPLTGTTFTDPAELADGHVVTYLVRSVDAKGKESFEAAIARTQPPVPVHVVATHREDGLVRVTWEKAKVTDVVGYHVYRAPVTVGGLYGNRPLKDLGTFTRITTKPVRGTTFLDRKKPERGEKGWAFVPRAYCVRAVNGLGVESGPSPWVVTLPAAVQRIRVRRRTDGAVVVRWDKDSNPDVVGYVVYRQDNWRNDLVTRLNAVPVTGTLLVDPDGRPTGERQRYWVVAVDAHGQEGPSGTGAWSFNRS